MFVFLLDIVGKDIRAMCIESTGCDTGWGGLLLPLGVIMHHPMHDSVAFLVCRISGN